jgi:hypothetical protein
MLRPNLSLLATGHECIEHNTERDTPALGEGAAITTYNFYIFNLHCSYMKHLKINI